MSYVDVGSVADFAEGRLRRVEVDGRDVVVTKWRGSLFALRNVCPHQTQSFEGGYVIGTLGGTVGHPELDEDRPVIVCPLHHYKYDAATGRCVVDPRLRVRVYPVHEREGRVLVEIGSNPGTPR